MDVTDGTPENLGVPIRRPANVAKVAELVRSERPEQHVAGAHHCGDIEQRLGFGDIATG